MDTIKIQKKRTQMVAHRGVCGIETENTMSSFVAACNRSYMGVETDVHTTIDGEFVLMHDDFTGRVAGDNVEISKTTYAYLKELVLNDRSGIAPYDQKQIYGDKGRGDLRIPRLSEYVRLCKKYGKKCVIEIKNHFDPKDIKRMIELIEEIGYLHNVIFIAFDINVLVVIREMLPEQELEFLSCKFDDEVLGLMNKYSIDLDVEYKVVTKEVIDKIHANGHRINCWTCDDKATAEKLVDWGIDYITSNILE